MLLNAISQVSDLVFVVDWQVIIASSLTSVVVIIAQLHCLGSSAVHGASVG